MKFFAAVAALAVAAVANAQYTFTNCATGATDMSITSFTLNPYPLCVGQQVCATINGTLAQPVTAGGKLTVLGRYLSKVVYTDSLDLCTVLSTSGAPCPVAVTVTSVTACILVKATAPVGIPVVLNLLAMNGNGHVLFNQCATVTAANCPA